MENKAEETQQEKKPVSEGRNYADIMANPQQISSHEPERENNKNSLIICGLLVFLVLVGIISYFALRSSNGNSQVNEQEQSKQYTTADKWLEEDNATHVSYREGFLNIRSWKVKIGLPENLTLLNADVVDSDADVETFYVRVVNKSLVDKLSKLSGEAIGSIPGNYIARAKRASLDPFGTGDEVLPIYKNGEYNYFTYEPTGFFISESLSEYADEISNNFRSASSTFGNSEAYLDF